MSEIENINYANKLWTLYYENKDLLEDKYSKFVKKHQLTEQTFYELIYINLNEKLISAKDLYEKLQRKLYYNKKEESAKLIKTSDELLNEVKEKNQDLIEKIDATKNTLSIKFKHGSKTLFKDLKPVFSKKIEEFKGVEGVYFHFKYYVNGIEKE